MEAIKRDLRRLYPKAFPFVDYIRNHNDFVDIVSKKTKDTLSKGFKNGSTEFLMYHVSKELIILFNLRSNIDDIVKLLEVISFYGKRKPFIEAIIQNYLHPKYQDITISSRKARDLLGALEINVDRREQKRVVNNILSIVLAYEELVIKHHIDNVYNPLVNMICSDLLTEIVYPQNDEIEEPQRTISRRHGRFIVEEKEEDNDNYLQQPIDNYDLDIDVTIDLSFLED